MKNLVTRVFAFMLVVWYCLSIIGFGVHTCSESNRSFLTNFISGVSCEDVHPSDVCKASCCSAHKHKNSCSHHSADESKDEAPVGMLKITNKTCCSNDYQQIDLTGSGQVSVSEQSACPLTFIALCSTPSYKYDSVSFSKMIQTRALFDADLCVGKLRPLLSIWRI